jgi:large subunit ribosomal protein L24
MRVLAHHKTAGKRNRVRHQRNAERVVTSITKGDVVRVMRGEERGREGRVLRVFLKKGRATVEGLNMVKRHRKARRAEEQSEIIEMPAPMALSNLMLLDPKTGEPTRLRTRIDNDGTKERISAKSGDAIPRRR